MGPTNPNERGIQVHWNNIKEAVIALQGPHSGLSSRMENPNQPEVTHRGRERFRLFYGSLKFAYQLTA